MSLQELPALEVAQLCDTKDQRDVCEHREVWSGRIISVVEDLVRLQPDAQPVVRQYTCHPGAVAVVALRGEPGAEEILLERQYRHPVGALLWEIPAGLLDHADEEPHLAAARELAEEADLTARRWDVLVDIFTSPGGTNEALRVFLARDVTPTPTPFPRSEEEAELVVAWVPVDEAVQFILDGKIHSPSAMAGVLAAHAARTNGWRGLRSANAPWLR